MRRNKFFLKSGTKTEVHTKFRNENDNLTFYYYYYYYYYWKLYKNGVGFISCYKIRYRC
jgi:hypothetical protein